MWSFQLQLPAFVTISAFDPRVCELNGDNCMFVRDVLSISESLVIRTTIIARCL